MIKGKLLEEWRREGKVGKGGKGTAWKEIRERTEEEKER